MVGLLLMHVKIMLSSGNLSGFRIFSGFFRILIRSSDFLQKRCFTSHIRYDDFYPANLSRFRIFPDFWWIFLGFLMNFSRIFLDFPAFSRIFMKIFTFLYWMDSLLLTYFMVIFFHWYLSGSRIFSYIHHILRFIPSL